MMMCVVIIYYDVIMFTYILVCCYYIFSICRQKYNEYVLCLKKNDSDEEVCADFRQLAVSICPQDWVRHNRQ